MNEISRLLGAGYGISFEPWHDGRTECTLMTPTGDVTTALGDTPAAALAEAVPPEALLVTEAELLARLLRVEESLKAIEERLDAPLSA